MWSYIFSSGWTDHQLCIFCTTAIWRAYHVIYRGFLFQPGCFYRDVKLFSVKVMSILLCAHRIPKFKTITHTWTETKWFFLPLLAHLTISLLKVSICVALQDGRSRYIFEVVMDGRREHFAHHKSHFVWTFSSQDTFACTYTTLPYYKMHRKTMTSILAGLRLAPLIPLAVCLWWDSVTTKTRC